MIITNYLPPTGHGSVVQVFFGDNPVRTILETFDHLSVSDKSILLQYPLDNIKSLLCSSSQQPLVITDALHSHNEEESEVIREGDDVSSGDEREAKRRCHDDGSHPSDDNNDSVKDIKRKERKENYLKAAALLQRRQMDGLLIACRFHPENILMSLLEFIAPSRPIVVYCQFQEVIYDHVVICDSLLVMLCIVLVAISSMLQKSQRIWKNIQHTVI
jgi:tRNA (adenine-N(1)-)-methyltransferase non-catalytic subunit